MATAPFQRREEPHLIPSNLKPRVHLFVCTNRRPDDSPLGAGCGGDELYATLKKVALARGQAASVWVTATACLGLCPKVGSAVAIYPSQRLVTSVGVEDAQRLYDEALVGSGA